MRELIEAPERDCAALAFARALRRPERRVRVAALRRNVELPRRFGEVARSEGRRAEAERILRVLPPGGPPSGLGCRRRRRGLRETVVGRARRARGHARVRDLRARRGRRGHRRRGRRRGRRSCEALRVSTEGARERVARGFLLRLVACRAAGQAIERPVVVVRLGERKRGRHRCGRAREVRRGRSVRGRRRLVVEGLSLRGHLFERGRGAGDGHGDRRVPARVILRTNEERARADHEEEDGGHRRLRTHRPAPGDGERARHAALDRDDLLSLLRGSEDPIFEALGGGDEGEGDGASGGRHVPEDRRAASAPRHVPLDGSARELIQLFIELVEQQGFELLAIHRCDSG